MHHKRLHGLWSQESAEIHRTQQQLSSYKTDLAVQLIGGQSPSVFLETKESRLLAIEQKIKSCSTVSFFNSRLPHIRKMLEVLLIDIQSLKKELHIAEIEANYQALKQAKMINRTLMSYQSMDCYEHLVPRNYSVKFLRSLSFRVWYYAQKKLDYFKNIQNIKLRKHNSLAWLLLTDDQSFAESVRDDTFSIAGEIGLLVVQRLQSIYFDTKSSSPLKKIAGKKIRELMTSSTGDGLLSYNANSLVQEIKKLVLHASLYPNNKIAWLGTARAVQAMIDHAQPICIYFNPNPQDMTWALNRLWLQAAMHLGYQFRLVEQHFPVIEAAILSRDPSKFLAQLLLETRADRPDNTSQYNGNDAPTATNQEILALMDMGCVAYKHEEDQSISFFPPQYTQEEPMTLCSKKTHDLYPKQKGRLRSHSAEAIHVSEPPPYSDRNTHFSNWAGPT